jgi:hypothetical protein
VFHTIGVEGEADFPICKIVEKILEVFQTGSKVVGKTELAVISVLSSRSFPPDIKG